MSQPIIIDVDFESLPSGEEFERISIAAYTIVVSGERDLEKFPARAVKALKTPSVVSDAIYGRPDANVIVRITNFESIIQNSEMTSELEISTENIFSADADRRSELVFNSAKRIISSAIVYHLGIVGHLARVMFDDELLHKEYNENTDVVKIDNMNRNVLNYYNKIIKLTKSSPKMSVDLGAIMAVGKNVSKQFSRISREINELKEDVHGVEKRLEKKIDSTGAAISGQIDDVDKNIKKLLRSQRRRYGR